MDKLKPVFRWYWTREELLNDKLKAVVRTAFAGEGWFSLRNHAETESGDSEYYDFECGNDEGSRARVIELQAKRINELVQAINNKKRQRDKEFPGQSWFEVDEDGFLIYHDGTEG